MSIFKFYLSKFTGKNFKKAFRYILAGEFRHLFMILKIRWAYAPKKKIKDTDIAKWIANNLQERQDFYDETVDIIIPVYNGAEYFDALLGSLKHTDVKYNLFIVDDCSTDEHVAEYLKNLAQSDSRVTVITNEENLGFVKSVNKAFNYTKNHIALLNTDIVLPPYWLERLMYPIINMKNVASSTPFTNCGTLCSFPKIGDDNPLFESLSCEEIDLVFRKIMPVYTELPTGVGFCMGMSKDAIKAIGVFDEKTFTRGYGEENDWCQRAIKAGFINVMVENLFVYHKHSGSFLSDEKKALIERNTVLLSKKHPRYNAEVAAFFEKDPLKQTREFAAMYMLYMYKTKKKILMFDHSIGGGATDFLESKVRRHITSGDCVIIIRYDSAQWNYIFEFKFKDYIYKYVFNKIEGLQGVLDHFRCDELIINELVTYPEIYKLLDFIKKTKKRHNMKLIMYIHDYYSVCPMVNLLSDKHVYCNLPGADICKECFKWRNDDNDYGCIKTWRENWGAFLSSCNEIIAFSNDSRDILEKVYAKKWNIIVSPHTVDYMIKVEKKYKTSDTINIGLIGILTFHKGLRIIKDMLKIIAQKDLNIKVILIGSSKKQLKHKYFYETGRYNKESLPLLAMQNDIDIFFIASIIPETFSYTTEEIIKMNLPVAVFDLGAPAERVSEYDKGLIIDSIDAQTALEQITEFVYDNPYRNTRVLFIGEYISFSSRYRVEHFREQLLMQGVTSDYVDIKKCAKVDIKRYDTALIYRCRHTVKLENMIKAFKASGKKVFYDIDDFTFEYSQIKQLRFLKDEEYRGYEGYTKSIKSCMSLCDGYITSTENMKSAIQSVFPGASVKVNRNAASMEMASISISAVSKVIKSADKVILGYFSGSKTHDGDFEIISNTILSLLEKYERLNLMIVGCLSLPDVFKVYEERIIRCGFVDWRELPGLIASVDINLMPVENSLFHRCKSENKWMEAALVAVPTVCSYNDELERVIENEVTGFLCENDEEWHYTLTRLIEEPDLRKTIGNAAKDIVFENYITTTTGKSAIDFVLS
ncbi:MAG: glycosyltransferase [Oscillospiraceae bacterium]|jgi:GT2 family glycosyltransferase/glycosyltransferase involved in cell wall biosynthesis|nr:glycosyltransferase [Oscillospiraceae bacterium]